MLGFLFTTIQEGYAQTETPPPPPQYFPTQETNKPDYSDTECPEGNPTGYGVKTPSALWWNLCGHCLNDYGIDMSTPAPTPTSTPIPTGLINVSIPWIAGTENVQDYWYLGSLGVSSFSTPADKRINVDLTTINQADYPWTFSFIYKGDGKHTLQAKPGTNTLILRFNKYLAGELTCQFREGSYLKEVDGEVNDLSNQEFTITEYLGRQDYIVATDYTNKEWFVEWDIEVDCQIIGSGSASYEFGIGLIADGGYTEDHFELNTEFLWNEIYAVDDEEPPVTDSVCSQILEEGEEGSIEDVFGFKYTGWLKGLSYCASIGPYDFNFLGLDFEIPYVAYVCVQDIGLGNISMLGVSISLDAFTIILACAWILRNLFIS